MKKMTPLDRYQATKQWKLTIDSVERNADGSDTAPTIMFLLFVPCCVLFGLGIIGILTMWIQGYSTRGLIITLVGFGGIIFLSLLSDLIEREWFSMFKGFIDSPGGALILATILTIPTIVIGIVISLVVGLNV